MFLLMVSVVVQSNVIMSDVSISAVILSLCQNDWLSKEIFKNIKI